MPELIGITTTVPVEVIYAAGHIPVDLNNEFISHPDPESIIKLAESHGFPAGVCAWIKGIYSSALKKPVDKVVTVVHGDCANTVALSEVFAHKGMEVIEFAYPHKRDRKLIAGAIAEFTKAMGATKEEVDQWKQRLDRIRYKLSVLDELTYRTGQVSGFENHSWLVSSSDFIGDPDGFERDLDGFLDAAQKRAESESDIRLGVIGVPTILDDLYQVLERPGISVVFNEVQRQFAMPGRHADLVSQYENYTYPFDLPFRIEDLTRQVALRNIDGLVHYIQSFCHRQIEDMVIKDKVGIPVLTIEGDNPGNVDGRVKTRIDAFLEMLSGN